MNNVILILILGPFFKAENVPIYYSVMSRSNPSSRRCLMKRLSQAEFVGCLLVWGVIVCQDNEDVCAFRDRNLRVCVCDRERIIRILWV